MAVKKNKTPFTVSSSAKVKNLNADLLDGVDSSQLQRQISGACGAGSATRVDDEGEAGEQARRVGVTEGEVERPPTPAGAAEDAQSRPVGVGAVIEDPVFAD